MLEKTILDLAAGRLEQLMDAEGTAEVTDVFSNLRELTTLARIMNSGLSEHSISVLHEIEIAGIEKMRAHLDHLQQELETNRPKWNGPTIKSSERA